MRKALLIAMCLAAWVIPGRASATPFTITSGLFGFDSEGDFFTFIGDDFQIRSDSHVLLTSRKLFAPRCSQCRAGDLVDWSFVTPGDQLLGVGDVTVNGVTTTAVAFLGSMTFNVVPTPFPDGDGGERAFVAPFEFFAEMRFVKDGVDLFSASLEGPGEITVYYEGIPPGGPFRTADEAVVYAFSPLAVPAPAPEGVPEPGTFVVLALSGLGVAGWDAMRRRRSILD